MAEIVLDFSDRYFPKQKEVFEEILHSDSKYYILNISRGGGKTVLLIDLIIHYLFEGFNDILFVSKTIPQAKKVFEQLNRTIQSSGLEKFVLYSNKSDREVKVTTNSRVIFKGTENPNGLRGQNEHTIVICDEFAFFNEDAWNTALRQISGIIKVKKVIISSTPKGYNEFYNLCRLAQDCNDGYYRYYSYTYRENPYGQALRDVEDAKSKMPSWLFSQEYECQFIGDGFSAFSDIEDVCNMNVVPYNKANRYCAGIDIGLSNDFTVVSIMNQLGEQVYYSRFNNVSTEVWVDRVNAILQSYNVVYVTAEMNYEQTLLKLLRNKNRLLKIEFHRTMASNKNVDVEKMIVAFDYREIRLLNDAILKAEFEQFSKIDTPTSYTYKASSGNDDIVMGTLMNFLTLPRIKSGNSIRIR